jgi:hypothetical protein
MSTPQKISFKGAGKYVFLTFLNQAIMKTACTFSPKNAALMLAALALYQLLFLFRSPPPSPNQQGPQIQPRKRRHFNSPMLTFYNCILDGRNFAFFLILALK